MQTDKPITEITGIPVSRLSHTQQMQPSPFDIDQTGNAQVWNDYLKRVKKTEEKPSWFTSSWMFVECYMYR